MKRLVVCCDGTWQSQDNEFATNVLKIAKTVNTKARDKNDNEITQILYYDQGIGTIPDNENEKKDLEWDDFWFKPEDAIDEAILAGKRMVYPAQRMLGGIFGLGIEVKIEEAYIFLCLNYEPGDEIYLFGFSRGAYTVRSLAGLIDLCGLLQRPYINHTGEAYKIYRLRTITEEETRDRQEKAALFRRKYKTEEPVPIEFLGCWDTVGALGIPNIIPWLSIDKYFRRNLEFHDHILGSIIKNARHAIAIDENRGVFEVTMMETNQDFNGTLKQIWFPGNHGCVGGGTNQIIKLPGNCESETLDLSRNALEWMAKEAMQLGLGLDLNLISQPDRSGKPRKIEVSQNIFTEERNISGFNDLAKDFDESIIDLWCHHNYRPNNLPKVVREKLRNICNNAR